MSTLNMQQDDHPAHNVPDPTEQYAGTELPNPWSDMGSYTPRSQDSPAKPFVAVGPSKMKGSTKMPRPPIRPGD